MTSQFTYYYNKLKEYSNDFDTLEDLIEGIEEDYRNNQKVTYDEMKLLLEIANFFEIQ